MSKTTSIKVIIAHRDIDVILRGLQSTMARHCPRTGKPGREWLDANTAYDNLVDAVNAARTKVS